MQLFCLPTPQLSKSNEMAWLPERPIGPRLSEDAFAHSVKVESGGFVMEPACLTSCFVAWPPNISTSKFCLNIPSLNRGHPHITIKTPTSARHGNLGLFLYLNVSPEAHTLLVDCRKNGAAFSVTTRQNNTVKLEYYCPLEFYDCWEDHSTLNTDYIPAEAVSKKATVCISG